MNMLNLQELAPEVREKLLAAARAGSLKRDKPSMAIGREHDAAQRGQLSFAQGRLWFIEQLGQARGAYHVSGGLRLRGTLDRRALRQALDTIAARHESLRTRFVEHGGEPSQVVAAAASFALAECDISATPELLQRHAAHEAQRPFDLATGPLARGLLLDLGNDEHALVIALHHIVADGWSIGVLFRELEALYAAFSAGQPDPLPPLPVQYADYAAWQRRWLGGAARAASGAYWQQALAGAPVLLELPADRPRPAQHDYLGGVVPCRLDAGLTADLQALSRRHGTTLFMTLLASWALLLARVSGQSDVVTGTPSANRGRPEIDGLIGLFINMLPIRIQLDEGMTVAGLLAAVKAQVMAAQQHQDTPFEQIVEAVNPPRSTAHHPLFQSMFSWQNDLVRPAALAGLALEPFAVDVARVAKFDLSLTLRESGDGIDGEMEFAAALFDAATVTRFAACWRSLLQGMTQRDDGAVALLPLWSDTEQQRALARWLPPGTPADGPELVHAMFERQAARTPDAVALQCDAGTVSYADLNARANRLAHHLADLGAGPDKLVAVCCERSVDMVVGLLAVLKAGAAYVPLDPAYPRERLADMLADCAPVALLTQRALMAALPADGMAGVRVLVLDEPQAWAAHAVDNPDPARLGLRADHLAYVIYTSGSTGRPKGAMNEHRAVANRLEWMQQAYGIGAADAVLQKTPFGFDVSVWEFFWPLAVGARLVVAWPDGHKDPHYLAQAMRRHGVTVVHFVPSMLQAFVAAGCLPGCTMLRHVFCSGEALPAALARAFGTALPGVPLHNLYGPTEAAVDVTHHTWRGTETTAVVPIGRPIANARLYIIDAHGQLLPPGIAGEIHIGGIAVARGYLNRPQLSAERFVADPFNDVPGARMYRTGDVGRWLPDGSIEYLGRNDFQVKIRGLRIEPGEIEAALLAYPGVREACVLARRDDGDTTLVAYLTGALAAAPAEALRPFLLARLPEYMVPAAYVALERLPLTPNGKLDRKALPAPDRQALAARPFEAPQGPAETALAGIWAALLKLEQVGRHDHFFELGGHSLLAVRMVAQLRQALGIDVALGTLFMHPVLAAFAQQLADCAEALPAVGPAAPEERALLSFAQQRLWFLAQMERGSTAYHMPGGLRLRGALDRDALRRALDGIVARHEALRTRFTERDGEPLQVIDPPAPFALAEYTVTGEAALAHHSAEEAAAPFDLAAGPLVRGRLLRLADDDHALLITLHHIVADGWSIGVLFRELEALYAAFRSGGADPLPPLAVQYPDYAAWQRRWLAGAAQQRQVDYWRTALAGAPALLEVPADRVRPAQQDYRGDIVRCQLDAALTAQLRALSQRHGTTLFMTLLAGWALLLARLAGQDDVVIGTPSANRARAELEPLIGFFVSTLPLRVTLAEGMTVAQLLAQVKAQVLAAQQHQDLPFEQIVEAVQPVRSLAHAPLFQAMFAWQTDLHAGLALPGLAVHTMAPPPHATAKFDLSLSLGEAQGAVQGMLEFATALFDPTTVTRYLAHWHVLLAAMAADDAAPVARLALLTAAERTQVTRDWNATAAPYASERCAHELFEAQVARTPAAPALAQGDCTLTYAELNARANRLARHLRALGVVADARVAICAERGFDMVIALLAVLKAGGAYVPVDPAYPDERLAYLLADSAPVVLLTQAGLAPRLAGGPALTTVLLDDATSWAAEAAHDLARGAGLTSASLAYVIYTSGSTGQPKGVQIEHHSLVHLAAAQALAGLAPAHARVLQFASAGFDACTFEIAMALLHGGTLVLPPADVKLAGPALAQIVRQHAVTHLTVPHAVLATLPDEERLESVTTLVVAGDALPAALAQRWAADRLLVNAYGPTETTVWATLHRCDVTATGSPPIGKPIANTRIYILDDSGEPVPAGVTGEIHIGGAGVGRGYLHRPDLTAQRFVSDPFGGVPGARMYRTGDLGRWLADGSIDYLGRNDFQVKIRGFRIEPGEIEAVLAGHDGIGEAAVLAWADDSAGKRLVAYVVGRAGAATPAAGALRDYLLERLPEYMVPAAYVALERLPLTPNGKLDRKALPAPDRQALAARPYEAPQGPAETALAGIWATLLNVERIGRHDHFFELGGHSLLAVRMVSQLRQALGIDVALGTLFTHPVLAAFAQQLADCGEAVLPPVGRAAPEERALLSFAQQRLWFMAQMESVSTAYHMPGGLRLRGALDREALRRALDAIVARHEALRTRFVLRDGEPRQLVDAAAGFALAEYTVASDAELARHIEQEAAAPFDLATGPLVRGRLLRLADDDHALLITLHHIVADGWSIGVLFRELEALYAAFRSGGADPLAPLAVQYPDYAAWQRRWLAGAAQQRQVDYWRTALAGAPALLEVPADRVRPAQQDYRGDIVRCQLDAALTAQLRALSQRHGTTLFMTLLAGWALLLARLAGQDDVVIGTPSANRARAELEPLIGFFVSTLPLRVTLAEDMTVAQLLAQVKAQVLAAQQHQDLPFEQIVEAVQPVRSLAHAPLFQAMFAWQTDLHAGLALPGLAVHTMAPPPHATAKFDLSLSLGEAGGTVQGMLEFATALFDPTTVTRYLAHWHVLLAAMAADDAAPVARLALLTAAERTQVTRDWNATAVPYASERCAHELFEAQAARTPAAPALAQGDCTLTYAELNARANRLARHLRALGVVADARVAICAERGFDMVIALLAVLKAGGAYVPVDPAYPDERLAYLLADSAPVVLLTQAGLAPRLAGGPALATVLLDDATSWSAEAAHDLARGTNLTPASLAYVIYTSGSTGQPKGVQIEHRALCNYLCWAVAAYAPSTGAVVSSSLSFDATITSLVTPLLCGGTVQLLREGREIEELELAVRRPGCGLVKITPAHLDVLGKRLRAEGAASHAAMFVIGGEALAPATVALWREVQPGVRLINEYGPTETVVGCIVHEVTAQERLPAQVPIGKPIANTQIYLLDACGALVPPGVTGEIHIGGAGVARGYLDRPELTAQRFVPDPFGGVAGARLYRTGDLARWRADGVIEYLGRNDFQVKIRGFRIELGEIEAALGEHEGVGAAAVLARADDDGKRLVAYVTGRAGKPAPAAETLRAYLLERLPEYMVPAAYVALAELPLTPNGKLDREALPAPDQQALTARPYEAPQGPVETALAEIWAALLKVERVGRHDHFFELGGHSLMIVTLLERMRQRQMVVDVRAVFTAPTVAGLAGAVGNAAAPIPIPPNLIPAAPAGARTTRLTI